MKSDIDRFLGCLGLLMTAGGYGASLLGLIDDTFYVFAALLLGVFLAAWNHYSAKWDMKTGVGFDTGTRHARSKSDRARAKALFWLSCVIVVVALLVDGFCFLNLVDAESVAIRPDVSTASAMGVKDDLPVARCWRFIAPQDAQLVAIHAQEAVYVTVLKRSRVPWVQIEDVVLVVDEFERERDPSKSSLPAGPWRPPIIFIGNIDRSVIDGRRNFRTTLVQIDSEHETGFATLNEVSPIILIEDRRPQRVIVKVNAEASGVYTYHVRIKFRYLWQTQVWESPKRKVRFVLQNPGSGEPPPPPPG